MGGGVGVQAWSGAAAELLAALRDDVALPPVPLRALLSALRADPPPGVWHPTGFVVLALHTAHDGALRLHLWPASEREHGRPCWPVHDHVWDLRSQVLCGQVESHGYEVLDDAAGDAVLYAVEYDRGRSSCMRRSERRVRVRAHAPRRVEAGQRYEVAAGEFHASRVGEGDVAATLVATRPRGRPWPWVVGDVDGPPVVPVERPVAEAARVRALLQRVEAGLG